MVLFDGDQVAGYRGGHGEHDSRRAFWAGVCFGFAVAVKIWAAVPALMAWVLCLPRGVRRARGVWRGGRSLHRGVWGDGVPQEKSGGVPKGVRGDGSPGIEPSSPRGEAALPFAGGFAAGIAVPCLPFLALAPSGFGRTILVSELVQATHGRVGANPRLADITGLIGLSRVGVNPPIWAGAAAAAVLFLFVVTAWLRARRAGSRATALDWFAFVTTVVVIGMLFSPSEWYVHYAAFAGTLLVILMGLSAARIWPGKSRREKPRKRRRRIRVVPLAAVLTALAIAAMGAADGYAMTTLHPALSLQGASALIPPGACVLTDTASVTIVIDRFSARSPGCPAVVDTVGTLIASMPGQDFVAGPGVLQADTQVWQLGFRQAGYVWLIGDNGNNGARIAWTPALHAYFVGHFRLIGLPSSILGGGDVPRGGLYIRKA